MLKRYHDERRPATFELLPAIDLRGGRVVRLRRGDFDQETPYADDPLAVARSFAEAGVRWLHVVDLDGARAGEPRHTDAIAAITREFGTSVAIEVAGGLRSVTAVGLALSAGAARAVVGTAALQDPRFVEALVARFGAERVAVAVDVREGVAVGGGWLPGQHGVPLPKVLAVLSDAGARTFEVTAIDRDGTLEGPDLVLLGDAVGMERGAIIASAGISSIADLQAVRSLGCSGAIVGRALYEGRLELREALAAAGR